jgi:hypothetical protein
LTPRPTPFNADVLTLDKSAFFRPWRNPAILSARESSVSLLRTPIIGVAGCCARAATGVEHRRSRRATEKRDELAPFHAPTSDLG